MKAERVVVFFNSCGESRKEMDQVFNNISKIRNVEELGPWKMVTKPHKKQIDGSSCGILLIKVSITLINKLGFLCLFLFLENLHIFVYN